MTTNRHKFQLKEHIQLDNKTSVMASSTKYQKFTHLQHILARPDTYIGSLSLDISNQWVISEDDKFKEKQVTHIAGLYKIYDEILVNAIDQCVTDCLTDKISIDVDESENSITITNTGSGVPVEQYNGSDVWIPEMIFGELLTSSNYDDNQDRITGGRNGYGAKLTNVFSKRFIVETACVKNHLKYRQEWTENMSKKNKAKITKYAKEKGYTSITFFPDLEKFGMSSLKDNDIIALFEKRAYDACACTPEKVKIFYNKKQLNYKSFEKYVDLYIGTKKETSRVYDKSDDNRWEICVSTSDSHKHVSFVNGINTTMGGSHVEYITSQIVKKVTEMLSQKHKSLNIKPHQIKDHLFVFVKATLVNPTFSSQTKTECTSRYRDFGSRFEVSDAFIKNVMKLGFVEDMISLIKHKEMRELNKTDGRKTSVIKGIPKLEDANKAGTIQSKKCTLILTEGDSAKTFAISGLSVVGRDYFGVFPLKGKLLNVREASAKQLLGNEEINNIKKIMGLQSGKKYTQDNLGDLRYGRILILTDADVDGSHIKGLLVNFIHFFWPSLIQCERFITFMKTPILKAVNKRNKTNQKSFYTKRSYEEWKQNQNMTQWTVKYYKGLGTSTAMEAREYFSDFQNNIVEFTLNEGDEQAILLAFKKELSNERKHWIQDGCINPPVENVDKKVNYTDFINNELRVFSISDNERSIPHVMDGLKPSQRKVLYACRKRASNSEIKVSQLSGYVSSETCYHHGEQSLMSTIINMAQNYVGSNNMNLLKPIGQFGTRLMGGKDAASPRYIFTNMEPVMESLFISDDDNILTYLEDDGTPVEPAFFVPTLPLILINGSEGIGTGYSTNIPCFNPSDVVSNVIHYLKNEQMTPMVPWYKGFTGSIEQSDEHKYVTKGQYTIHDNKSFSITELPIGKWTSDYKEFLDTLLETNAIKHCENNSSDVKVDFKITLNTTDNANETDIEKMFKLTSTLSTNNMHCFDTAGKLCKYASPHDIIKEFANTKLKYYKKRKEYLLDTFTKDLNVLSEKIRFMMLVIENEIIVFKKTSQEIEMQLKAHSFNANMFETLLGIKLYAFTHEKISELKNKIASIQDKITRLEQTSIKQFWMNDIKTIRL